ncbi:hypothetical protein BRD03_08675 [Halobacteriales archaeon QS_9_68_17]|nr:MAG: hypothetical protein BRD03_08675 [Halobacteriales archaeon QS_9_68_17]
MSRNSDSADESIDVINEAVDDGSGCAETWEALHALRRDGEESGRRSFLRRTATAGAATLGLPALVERARAAGEEADVTEVTGGDRGRVLSSALRDRRTRTLFRETVTGRRVRPDVGDAYTYRTATDADAWHTVVVPFESDDRSEQIYLFWSDNDDYETQVSLSRVSRDRTAADGSVWTVVESFPDGETVTTEEFDIGAPASDDEVTTQDHFLGCHNPDWGCILSTAGAYAGTIGACGACAGSGGWLVPACASCIGAILGSAGLTISCDYCED